MALLREHLTEFSVRAGEKTTKSYLEFYGYLFAKYRDGMIVTAAAHEASPACNCNVKEVIYLF